MKNGKTKKLTYGALFAAIATALMYFEFVVPFMPPFLKVDLSGVVSILASFMFGWGPAVLITAVKDLIHLMSTQTGGVGELADFLMISAFCIVGSYIYRKDHTKKGAYIGLAAGIAVMSLVGVLTNKFMLIPFYSKVMPLEAIIGACNAINPGVVSINTYLLFGVLPFNIIKGIILSVITALLYKRLSVIIKHNTIK